MGDQIRERIGIQFLKRLPHIDHPGSEVGQSPNPGDGLKHLKELWEAVFGKGPYEPSKGIQCLPLESFLLKTNIRDEGLVATERTV